jgi:hypothetical protein
MPHGHDEWVVAVLVAKLIIFARWRVPHWLKPLGVIAAYEIQRVHFGDWHPTAGEYLAMIVGLAATGALAPRWLEAESARELRRVCWLWAMYLGYYYAIRIPNDHYMWADFFFAALVLSARLARRTAAPRELRHHYAMLMLLSVVVAGWVTVAWTLHMFEWGVVYDWFPAAFVEENALLFVPIINGRYLIPVLMARLLLAEQLGDRQAYPSGHVWTAAGAKVVSLALILTGIGYAIADSEVYLESIQEAACLAVFVVALL